MGMAAQMRKRAIKATSATRSKKVIKTVTAADRVALNRSMEPIIKDNERMYREMTEYQAKNSHIYGSKTKVLRNKK